MQRKATAIWRGGIRDGKGKLSTESGALKEKEYSFSTRFENGAGTNPEELLAAAHAGCFSMALAGELGKANITPENIETTATLTLERIGDQWTISKSHLETHAKIPGVDRVAFEKATEAAKAFCPVSRLLKAEITLNASLEA